MKMMFAFFIFCIILFLYLHVQFHLKTSDDLEVYEIEDGSKDKLEEICDLRQPILFDYYNETIIKTCNKEHILNNYHAFEVKVRNTNDVNYNSEIYIPLVFHSADKLFNDDKSSSYFSENNSEFLEETGLMKSMKYNDEFIRPPMLSNSKYDIMMGSEGVTTPFRYEINYRNYFLVTSGSIKVKMCPPKNAKYLYVEKDYQNFEFRSPINCWKVQPQYTADFDKVKCLEVTVEVGKMLHIPAYWFYSIQFEKNTSVACFFYRTYMNNVAIIPHIFMYALQLQNVKHDIVKKVEIKEKEVEKDNKDSTNIDEL
jgi:hypothetical protein